MLLVTPLIISLLQIRFAYSHNISNKYHRSQDFRKKNPKILHILWNLMLMIQRMVQNKKFLSV